MPNPYETPVDAESYVPRPRTAGGLSLIWFSSSLAATTWLGYAAIYYLHFMVPRPFEFGIKSLVPASIAATIGTTLYSTIRKFRFPELVQRSTKPSLLFAGLLAGLYTTFIAYLSFRMTAQPYGAAKVGFVGCILGIPAAWAILKLETRVVPGTPAQPRPVIDSGASIFWFAGVVMLGSAVLMATLSPASNIAERLSAATMTTPLVGIVFVAAYGLFRAIIPLASTPTVASRVVAATVCSGVCFVCLYIRLVVMKIQPSAVNLLFLPLGAFIGAVAELPLANVSQRQQHSDPSQ